MTLSWTDNPTPEPKVKRAVVVATLCPKCGSPLQHEEKQTSEDGDGQCFTLNDAGWFCTNDECGFHEFD